MGRHCYVCDTVPRVQHLAEAWPMETMFVCKNREMNSISAFRLTITSPYGRKCAGVGQDSERLGTLDEMMEEKC